MMDRKVVLEEFIAQGGGCQGIHCSYCPMNKLNGMQIGCLPSSLALVEAKRMLLEEYTIPDILEKE